MKKHCIPCNCKRKVESHEVNNNEWYRTEASSIDTDVVETTEVSGCAAYKFDCYDASGSFLFSLVFHSAGWPPNLAMGINGYPSAGAVVRQIRNNPTRVVYVHWVALIGNVFAKPVEPHAPCLWFFSNFFREHGCVETGEVGVWTRGKTCFNMSGTVESTKQRYNEHLAWGWQPSQLVRLQRIELLIRELKSQVALADCYEAGLALDIELALEKEREAVRKKEEEEKCIIS